MAAADVEVEAEVGGVFAGRVDAAEVGLAGEIRPVPRIGQRISEAEKLGLSVIYVSSHAPIPEKNHTIEVRRVARVEDLVRSLFASTS